MKKILPIMIVVSVIALTIGIVGGYYGGRQSKSITSSIPSLTDSSNPHPTTALGVSPTPDLTANWRTHTENALHISFKYPQNWTEQVAEGGSVITAPNSKTVISIIGVTKKLDSTASDAVHDYLKQSTSNTPGSIQILADKEILLENRKGWQLHYKNIDPKEPLNNFEDKVMLVDDPYNKNRYQGLLIHYVSSDVDKATDQILLTFKFQDQQQTKANSDLTSYINKGKGYSFSYPTAWNLKQTSGGEGECVGIQIINPSKKSWINICPVDAPNGLDGIKINQAKVMNIIVSNHNAIEYTFQQFDTQIEHSINVENTSNRDLLWIHLIADVSENLEVKKVFDEIVSSFKFIN